MTSSEGRVRGSPDLAHLAREVAAAYRLGRHPRIVGPPESGRQGRVWPLVTTSGRYAVKVAFASPDPAAALLDAAYQDAVHAAGVPMPEVVRDPDGEVLRRLEDGTVVRVYTWVEVGDRDRTLDPALVGRTVAAIHDVDLPDDRPQHPWYTEPVGELQWRELADRSLEAGAPFGAALAHLVPELTALEELLVPSGPLRRCHCDLWADNVRPSGDGVVVLDWENSGPADPVGELPMVMLDFGRHDPDRMRELYAAYVTAGGRSRITGPGDCSMLVATLGHIIEFGVMRWLNATDPRERAAEAAWVAEDVDDPLTRRVVDTIVGAATSVTLPAP